MAAWQHGQTICSRWRKCSNGQCYKGTTRQQDPGLQTYNRVRREMTIRLGDVLNCSCSHGRLQYPRSESVQSNSSFHRITTTGAFILRDGQPRYARTFKTIVNSTFFTITVISISNHELGFLSVSCSNRLHINKLQGLHTSFSMLRRGSFELPTWWSHGQDVQ